MDRKFIKERAKEAFKANYWRCVAVSFVTSLVAGGGVAASGSSSVTVNNPQQAEDASLAAQNIAEQDPRVLWIVFGIIGLIVLIFSLISFLYDVFVGSPVRMGNNTFFLKNIDDSETNVEEMKAGFTPNYSRNAKTFALKKLFVYLWSLLFIIPGIIKNLGYSMTNYILAEDPDIAPMDALKKSEEMMKGHKWELFVFGLSFFGWILLTVLTFGLSWVFYVSPYMDAANAQFYKELKEETL